MRGGVLYQRNQTGTDRNAGHPQIGERTADTLTMIKPGLHHQLIIVNQTGQSQIGGTHQQMPKILPGKPRFKMNFASIGGIQNRPATNIRVASPQKIQRPANTFLAFPAPPIPVVYPPQKQPRFPTRGVRVQPGQTRHRGKPGEHVQRMGGSAVDEMFDTPSNRPLVRLAARRGRKLGMRGRGGLASPPSVNRFRQKASASPVGSVAAHPSAAPAGTCAGWACACTWVSAGA